MTVAYKQKRIRSDEPPKNTCGGTSSSGGRAGECRVSHVLRFKQRKIHRLSCLESKKTAEKYDTGNCLTGCRLRMTSASSLPPVRLPNPDGTLFRVLILKKEDRRCAAASQSRRRSIRSILPQPKQTMPAAPARKALRSHYSMLHGVRQFFLVNIL